MPQLPVNDTCLTADDVRKRNSKTILLRRAARASEFVPKVIVAVPKPEPPPPEPISYVPDDDPSTYSAPSLRRVLSICCEYFQVGSDLLRSDRRSSHLIMPRQIIYYLMTNCTTRSLPEIGDYMRRDHTTIMYGARKIKDLMPGNEAIATAVAVLTDTIKNGAPLLTTAPSLPAPPRPKKSLGHLGPYTKQEIADITRMFLEEKLSCRAIADSVGRSVESISHKIHRLGIRKEKVVDPAIKERVIAELQSYVKAGMSNEDIAMKIKVSVNTLKHRLARFRIKRATNTTVFTPIEEAAIKEMFRFGRRISFIAKKLSRTPSSIRWKLYRLGLTDQDGKERGAEHGDIIRE